jgi:ferredoxin
MPALQMARVSPNAVARVDTQLCSACGQCVEVCPTEAVSLLETAVVDERQCIGCGTCVEECPTGAMALAETSGGQGKVR